MKKAILALNPKLSMDWTLASMVSIAGDVTR